MQSPNILLGRDYNAKIADTGLHQVSLLMKLCLTCSRYPQLLDSPLLHRGLP